MLGGRESRRAPRSRRRGKYGGLQDAGHVEPHVVEPDPFAGEDPVDTEPLGGRRAEHGDGLLGGRGIEVVALRHAGTHGVEQAEAGGVDGEGVGVDGGDERAAVDVPVTVPVSWTSVTASMRPIIGRGGRGAARRSGRRRSGRFGRRGGWCRGRRSR